MSATAVKTYIDPRGIFRKVMAIDDSRSDVTLIAFECGHIGHFNQIFDYSRETQMRCFTCGVEARKAQERTA